MSHIELLNIGLRLMGSSQVLLFIILILLSKNPFRVRLVGTLCMIGSISYLITPVLNNLYSSQLILYFWFPASVAPSMLLMFVWFIFEENCTFPKWIFGLVGFSVSSSLWFLSQNIGLPNAPIWVQLTKAVVLMVSIVVVWNGRANDLVELRSKVRFWFVSSFCVLMLAIILIQIMTDFETHLVFDVIESLIIFIMVTSVNVLFVRLNPQLQLMSETTTVREKSDDPIIVELLQKMRDERLYANHDLRVAGLASELNVPEYLLRNKINQQLGYRNFNQFVNRYRIEEASEKLLEEVRLPVLSIALDVGFRSISSFNTAFQAQFGVSPTKYRAESLSDS